MTLNVNLPQFVAVILTYCIIFAFRKALDRPIARHAQYIMDNWQDDFEGPRPRSPDALRRTYWRMLLIVTAMLVMIFTKVILYLLRGA